MFNVVTLTIVITLLYFIELAVIRINKKYRLGGLQ